MNTTTSSLLERYETEIWQYVEIPDETHLVYGYELGREAADTGIGLLQLSEAHHRVVGRMVRDLAIAGISDAECVLRVRRAAEFFAESLASFEMVYQGYRSQISILEEQEQRLVVAQEAADRANQAKSEFLSGMSHELRTPLNAILGFGQLLAMDKLSDEHRDAVRHINNAGSHLLDLINEVLDISRIESGQLDLKLEPVSLAQVVGETLELTNTLARAHNVSLRAKPTARYVQADHQRLKQILVNLVANAIKYNRERGTVEITCETQINKQVRIAVVDTGIGIAASAIDRLFIPFERLGADQSNVEGTGLGLAMVKRLTIAMGGEIGVQSVEGEGSTFWIQLGFAETESPRPLVADIRDDIATRQSLGPQTILYVEDNPSNIQLLERVFTKRPLMTLLVATGGIDGVEFARQHQPGLILLDLNLSDISGEEVFRRLQADPQTSSIPVVVVSADALSNQVERLLSAGAVAYVTKPFDISHLLEVVDTAVVNSNSNKL